MRILVQEQMLMPSRVYGDASRFEIALPTLVYTRSPDDLLPDLPFETLTGYVDFCESVKSVRERYWGAAQAGRLPEIDYTIKFDTTVLIVGNPSPGHVNSAVANSQYRGQRLIVNDLSSYAAQTIDAAHHWGAKYTCYGKSAAPTCSARFGDYQRVIIGALPEYVLGLADIVHSFGHSYMAEWAREFPQKVVNVW